MARFTLNEQQIITHAPQSPAMEHPVASEGLRSTVHLNQHLESDMREAAPASESAHGGSVPLVDPEQRLAQARAEFQEAWRAKGAEKERRVQQLRNSGRIWMKRGRWCKRQALSCCPYFPVVAASGYLAASARWTLGAWVVIIGILGLGWAAAWTIGFYLCLAGERLRVQEIESL